MTIKNYKTNRTAFIAIVFLLISFSVTQSAKSQDTLNYKYFLGNSKPDTLWKVLGFDDSRWINGYGSIGFGDGDDSILIKSTGSVYLRHNLEFSNDYKTYKGMIIYADFDDGFIAYLNGHEVLRVNIDDSIENPTHLQTANRSHEAFGYRMNNELQLYNMAGYYIDSVQLSNCEAGLQNMLSFAIFNDSINGSDLTFGFHYQIIDTSLYTSIRPTEFISKEIADSTILPYVIIETDEYGVSDSNTIGWMGIINDTLKQYNKLTDEFTDYNGRIRLKLHGDYSLQFPKKSLRIELQDSVGENNNTEILGLPKENDFILYAPYQDKTQIKNVLTYNLGRKMGHYAPRTRYCELILNGQNMGLHVLVEKIKRDKNRVDIKKLEKDENSGTDLTGGYILEYNLGLNIRYPKEKDITEEQKEYITNFISSCEKYISDINYCSSDNLYKKLIDVNSLADYFIINELSMNFDAFSKSWYMYKDNDKVDGRLKFGPLWDYNVAWCYYTGQNYDGWRRLQSPILSFNTIRKDTSFAHLLINRWFNYRESILSKDSLFSLIDSITTAIAPAIERNYTIYPMVEYNEYGGYEGLTYDGWINETKRWIEGRLQWMDENIINFDFNPDCHVYLASNQAGINQITSYPNPFSSNIKIVANALFDGTVNISLIDLTGIVKYTTSRTIIAGSNYFELNIDNQVSAGYYTLLITKGNEIIYSQKTFKTN